MSAKNLLSFGGCSMVAVGTYCPLLRLFGITNQNLFQLNKAYGLFILFTFITGIILLSAGRVHGAQITARVMLALVIILFAGAQFKVYSTFSGMPFKGLGRYLEGQVKFVWGWYVLFAGAFLSVFTTLNAKRHIKK